MSASRLDGSADGLRGKATSVIDRRTRVRAQAAWLARAYAWLLVRLRWIVLIGCLVGVGAALMLLPALQPAGPGRALSVVPSNSPALRTEMDVLRRFHVPLLARTVVVLRNPDGLPVHDQAKVVKLAIRIDRHRLGKTEPVPGAGQVAGALPVVNTFGLFPSSRERGTTALLYLFYPVGMSIPDQVTQAGHLADRYFRPSRGTYVGVTGVTAAQQKQGQLAGGALDWVELAAALVIAVVVGWKFRCIGAPIAALATAGLAYEVSSRLIAWAGQRFSFAVPGELEPLLAVLVAGVSTDYCIFFLSAYRNRLHERADPRQAAQEATASVTPIVLTAGLSVVAGTATLTIADLSLFRQLGPGMAVSVAVSALAALVFLPALLACAGRAVFWPGRRPGDEGAHEVPEAGAGWRRRAMEKVVSHRPLAALTLALSVAVLGAGAVGLIGVGVGTDLISDLPSDTPPAVAAQQITRGFAPGVLAPTEIMVRGSGLNAERAKLDRLQNLVEDRPHVAGVLGPGDVITPRGHGVFLTPSGDAARFVVILDQEPYGAAAIATVQRLQQDMPGLLKTTGLSRVHYGVTGDTALSGAITTVSNGDLIRVGLLAVGVLLVILALFLRALLTPILLLAATLLSVVAALGITNWVFRDIIGTAGLTFYVPFAVAILLLSFGSDYNIFLVGRIWHLAKVRPYQRTIVDGAMDASSAITTAGLTLALSFVLLAIVPLDAFREFAFAMLVGVLLDTFLVRSVLVPALLALLGPAASWPSRRLRAAKGPAAAEEPVLHPQLSPERRSA